MKPKIAVTAPYLQLEWEKYKSHFDDFDVLVPKVVERFEEEEMLNIVSSGIEGIICGDDRITERVIDQATKLRVIVKWGTGIDSIDKEYAAKKGIEVRNTLDAFIHPVTESTIGLMLTILRKIDENNRLMHQGGWEKIKASTLHELTVGIIGYGRIGSSVANALSVFTENIIWHDLKDNSELNIHPGHASKRRSLGELLSVADIIALHCDLNSSSYHLISETNIAAMKDGVIIINTARGPIINEEELILNLKNGKIGYVGLDVFEIEPLPADSWLRNSDRCILLSHNTNSSPASWTRVHLNSIRMLKEYFK
ncbi:MAG: NAD(P)-dependent oxidoreductase [Bacteroidales bacterium]